MNPSRVTFPWKKYSSPACIFFSRYGWLNHTARMLHEPSESVAKIVVSAKAREAAAEAKAVAIEAKEEGK